MFSPLGTAVVAALFLPLLIFGLYWLFVVNGPTPVVKARIDTVTTEANNAIDENNVVYDPDATTYTDIPAYQLTGLYQDAKPYIDMALSTLQSIFTYGVLNAPQEAIF